MYNIRSLNIWKENSKYRTYGSKCKVLESDVSRRKETTMSEKCQMVFDEILATDNFIELSSAQLEINSSTTV